MFELVGFAALVAVVLLAVLMYSMRKNDRVAYDKVRADAAAAAEELRQEVERLKNRS